MERQSKIIKTSVIGIIVNLILVAFKATVGILVNSIAITLDAVNNLTDALSSIITIIGTKLAGKAPDKEHPYGYGRIEYFSSVIIAVIVLWAGITALQESWPKIFTPDVTSYTTVSLIIIAVAVAVKFVLGRYVKGVGEEINSQALVASGSDAFFDAILSLSTLIAAIVSIFYNIHLEGILGVIISFVIIKASIDMLKETLDSMIGARVDSELSQKIKKSIEEVDGVYGAYDLSLHNYGPEDMQGSVHVEVDDDLTAREIHKLTREITFKIYKEFSIALTVGIYARNDKYDYIRKDLDEIVSQYEEVLQIHGFYVYEDEKLVSFDIIVDFDADRKRVKDEILEKIRQMHPEFNYIIIDDYDVSD
ncbi:cation diffusion facilitator family transporter [Methanobrevibacter millerae]|uniref:Cation diffusion facilitator family transporter n=1 Tax=Methanobrevibacter millerae TaxID=230361 RepID=A0A1G5WJI4_9EURY|nr:cation diffusion facilitator family transporter [Methanobrevibacter millerae]SDA58172.1 cation diffusion facilitator family transporter [Methanobrevibacter millerae]